MTAETIRESAALRNIGLLMFDPSLGFCDALPGMPAILGNRDANPADEMEKTLQSFWTPLFSSEWISKPVRAFFRRVSLKIEESEPGERTVSPDAQAWMLRALAQCCRLWEDRTEAPWTGLVLACREMAFRIARFGMEHLRLENGWLAARRFDIFSDHQNDWDDPVTLHQGLWLEALNDLQSICQTDDLTLSRQVAEWISTQQASLKEGLIKVVTQNESAATYARLLQAVIACLETTETNREELESTMWILIACIMKSQDENGAWEGNLRSTCECIAAIARAGEFNEAAAYPDSLGRALGWLEAMNDLGGAFPAPMPGLRIWEYRLDDVSALLEATRRLAHLSLLHPEDRLVAQGLNQKWWRFAVGRRVKLPHTLQYSGLWVAGFRQLRESQLWYRDLRIEPGSIGRMAVEALSTNFRKPSQNLPTKVSV